MSNSLDQIENVYQSCEVSLEVIDIRRSFIAPGGERIDVLRGVSLELRAGESVAIMGASGSGKSTLLQLLGGLDDPDHGSIRLGDIDLVKAKGRDLAKIHEQRIGFVFQFHYLLPDLSAVENVAMPLLIARRNQRESMVRAREVLTEMGLETRADHPVLHLSGGEQQRIAVARALMNHPELLLADEPTGNLDSEISEEIGKSIVDYARRGRKMSVIATHNQNVARLCDCVLLLREGRLYSC